MEATIFGQGLRDGLRLKRFLPWMFVALICFVIAFIWDQLQTDATPKQTYTSVSSIFVFHILALASAIYTTAIISQEVEQKTIVYLLTRPVPRWKLLVYRYLASVIVVSIIGVVSAILSSIGAYHGFGSNPFLLKDCIALIVGSFAYGALFLLVSVFLNRSMIYCLLFAFGWETLIPNMPGQMYILSINSYIQGIAQHAATEASSAITAATTAVADNTPSPMTAYATMIPFSIVLVLLSALFFSIREYLPREDSE